MKYKKQIVLAVLTIAGVLTLTPGVYVANAPDLKAHLTAQIPGVSAEPLQLRGPTQVREKSVVMYDFLTQVSQGGDASEFQINTTNFATIVGLRIKPNFLCAVKSSMASSNRVITLFSNAGGKCAGTVSVLFWSSVRAQQNVELSYGTATRTLEVSVQPIAFEIIQRPGETGGGHLEINRDGSIFKASCNNTSGQLGEIRISSTRLHRPVSGNSNSAQASLYFEEIREQEGEIFCSMTKPYLSGATTVFNRSWGVRYSAIPGNGITEPPGEECDGGDGCTTTFKRTPPPLPPHCGDSIIQTGEFCDDGNGNDATDGCTNQCTVTPTEEILLLFFEETGTSSTIHDLSGKNTHGIFKNANGTNKNVETVASPKNNSRAENLINNTFIEFPANSDMNFNGASYLISFWANPEDGGTVMSNRRFISSGEPTEGTGWSISLTKTQLKLEAQSGVNTDQTTLSATGNFAGWNHISLVIKTGSNTIFKSSKAYLNGNTAQALAFQTSETGTGFRGNLTDPSASLRIGVNGGGIIAGNYFTGSLDNVLISRGERSDAVFATAMINNYQIALQGSAAFMPLLVPDLLIDLPFNEGGGSPLIKDFAGDDVAIFRTYDWTRSNQVLEERDATFGKTIRLDKDKSQFIDLGHGFDLDGEMATMTFWAKIVRPQTADPITLFSKRNSNNGWTIQIARSSSSTAISGYELRLPAKDWPSNAPSAVQIPDIFDQWTHFAFVLDSAPDHNFKTYSKVYINGNPLAISPTTTVAKSNSGANSNTLVFGARPNENWTYDHFNGWIDDLFIVKRALTPIEIRYLKDSTIRPRAADKVQMTGSISTKNAPAVSQTTDEWNWGE